MSEMTAPFKRGRFITFEGLDGCGKSTQLQRLAATLASHGIRVVTTREPGGTPLGEDIRHLLLNSSASPMHPLAELALMFSSRVQLVAEVIVPALATGSWVLCDRFVDSSEAYQGGGRQLGSEQVCALRRQLLREFQPDLTLWLKHDVSASVARATRRRVAEGALPDRFEQESLAFYERVHQAFCQIAARESHRVVCLDAKQSIEAIQSAIWDEVAQRFWKIPTKADSQIPQTSEKACSSA